MGTGDIVGTAVGESLGEPDGDSEGLSSIVMFDFIRSIIRSAANQ